MKILRYLGFAKESEVGFGTLIDAIFHVDIANSSLDSPSEPGIHYPGGLGRFARRFVPGAYLSSGNAEFAADISSFWYILYLLLGSKETSDAGITQVNDEAHPTGVGELTLDFDLVEAPCVFNSFELMDALASKVAEDDGFGKVVEANVSGISGTIDYIHKLDGTAGASVKLIGLDAEEAYTADYKYGQYSHVIAPVEDVKMPSASLRLGKDVFEHGFPGCSFSKLSLKVERELAMITLEIIGGKDQKETVLTKSTLKLFPEYPVPFHKMNFKLCDKGEVLGDISAKVNSLSLEINNNSDAEGGLGLGSRFPQEANYNGEFDITGELTLKFEDTSHKEDFWGAAVAPDPEGPQEKTAQIIMDGEASMGAGNGYGKATIDIFRFIYNAVNIQPSGREKLVQTIPFKAMEDISLEKIFEATVTSLWTVA